jgi:hypothetical protein
MYIPKNFLCIYLYISNFQNMCSMQYGLPGWDLFKERDLIARDKILALKVIRECNETKFVLFKEGPSMMNVQILQQRLEQIED